ncbi:MAG: enoyl-CoA hydratase-related protein, partial [Candidatus Dormibacteraeota bacterium]|nr:enoyl-CoA hydratase-related protein [Candidatus Dormibacteraeota bacterium]
GLVNHVVDPEEVAERTGMLVHELAGGAPSAQREIRRLVREVPALDEEAAYQAMVELSRRLFSSPEGAEGMAAFRERRRPDWRR